MLLPRSPAYRSLLNQSRTRYYQHHLTSQRRCFNDKPFPSPFPNRPIAQDKKQTLHPSQPLDIPVTIAPVQSPPPPPPQPSHKPLATSHSDLESNATPADSQSFILAPPPAVYSEPTLPESDTYAFMIRKHHFDTYRLLRALENQGFSRQQAEVVMKGIKFKLRESTAQLRNELLLRSDLENESYLFKAELSELRTEIQIMRRNDTQMLQTEASIITREVDALGQRLREDVAVMKNDVTLDMNNRKNETQEEQKAIDMKIQEINNKFTIQLGEVRTELEAVRWETIWKGMAGIAVAGFTIGTVGYLLTRFADHQAETARVEKLKRKKLLKEEARQSGAADMEVIY
ncbi:hypothetical protein DM01DRAFT_1337453 [Hesseltinella vesiculosa]|uniref:DUF1640-domain-containing protein n=1 Tax=Hesseltinella vesiculosa TaxID=101127 RepID=A0A1X2GCU3_9FUNG|nr:hypothetical protein DM01DRAFT_1337453 [Hesseltinella vesiculosa]